MTIAVVAGGPGLLEAQLVAGFSGRSSSCCSTVALLLPSFVKGFGGQALAACSHLESCAEVFAGGEVISSIVQQSGFASDNVTLAEVPCALGS